MSCSGYLPYIVSLSEDEANAIEIFKDSRYISNRQEQDKFDIYEVKDDGYENKNLSDNELSIKIIEQTLPLQR